MTTAMGPPAPRNPATTTTTSASTSASAFDQSSSTEAQTKPVESLSPSQPLPMKRTLMGPPPPINPNPPNFEPEESEKPKNQQPIEDAVAVAGNSEINDDGDSSTVNDEGKKEEQETPGNVGGGGGVAVPYTIPPWSERPCHNYFLEVLKDGSIIDQFDVYEKGAYMFGRVDLCDFVLEHPTISRFHAVLQFNKSGGAFLYDLSSTHGTFINKNQAKRKVYMELHVGDVIRFGHSSRLYIFQGPPDLMPPESDLKSLRNIKMREDRRDMEASLLRAKREAALADGISWGMDEDATEEIEDDIEEITWQTFKGQLTEKQEKTREKVLKRLEKIANMKKEIDAIRAKDIAQGGLTQGQQTQIARNEQRMSQIAEELENLEETLNESIRESLGARGGRVHDKKKGATVDDEDEYLSDEDEFYDRTRKKSSKPKSGENQSIETADSLLDKKDVISKKIEEKKKLLIDEKNKVIPENGAVAEAGDALDVFMSGLSSQLVIDRTDQLQKELDTLQSELERMLYLLRIADPTGEAARKRESITTEGKPNMSGTPVVKKQPKKKLEKQVEENIQRQGTLDVTTKPSKNEEEPKVVQQSTEGKATVYTVNKPQWLGAVYTKEAEKPKEAPLVLVDSDQFVDYKDRKEVLTKKDAQVNVDSGLENAAPGLIIRKRKQVEESDNIQVEDSDNSSARVEIAAEDAVALLLKHTRGIQASDDDELIHNGEAMAAENRAEKGKKKAKKVLGPEKPSFLSNETDYESWVPPEGQSGDGRTSLNDHFGY